MYEKSAARNAVLQLSFKVRVSPEEFLAHSREAADAIALVDGLIWKIWVVQQEESEVGGVYLFADREAAEAYLRHPLVQAACSNSAVVSTSSQIWCVENYLSAITRAPLGHKSAEFSDAIAMLAGGK